MSEEIQKAFIALAGVVIGALVGAWVTLRNERSKERHEDTRRWVNDILPLLKAIANDLSSMLAYAQSGEVEDVEKVSAAVDKNLTDLRLLVPSSVTEAAGRAQAACYSLATETFLMNAHGRDLKSALDAHKDSPNAAFEWSLPKEVDKAHNQAWKAVANFEDVARGAVGTR
jgi:hypothetical protein